MYIRGKSAYNAAVIFNIVDKLLPQVDAEWAETVTKDLRNEIIVSRIFCFAAFTFHDVVLDSVSCETSLFLYFRCDFL